MQITDYIDWYEIYRKVKDFEDLKEALYYGFSHYWKED